MSTAWTLRGLLVAGCLLAAPDAWAQRVQFPSMVESPGTVATSPPVVAQGPPPVLAPGPAPMAGPAPTFDPYAPAGPQPGPIVADPYAGPAAPGPFLSPLPPDMFATFGQYNDLATDIQLRRRFWVQPEYIGWWGKGNQLPVLATTSPPGTTLGMVTAATPPTTVLFGGNKVDDELQSGGRVTAGFWLNDQETWGIEEQFFLLADSGTSFNVNSLTTPIIARPFGLDPASTGTFTAFALPVSFPATIVGSLDIETSNRVEGFGILLRKAVFIDCANQKRLDILGGYRYFRLSDSVTIAQQSSTVSGFPPIPAGATFLSQDQFAAKNTFNGGDIGLRFQKYFNRFSVDVLGKLALGTNTQKVIISGTDRVGPFKFPFGVLAQSSNIGTYSRDVFTLLPELDVNLRADVTPNMRVVVGYTLLYLNKVQRSGDAIPTNVDLNSLLFLNTATAPLFAFQNSSYWLQGINLGLEYRF